MRVEVVDACLFVAREVGFVLSAEGALKIVVEVLGGLGDGEEVRF